MLDLNSCGMSRSTFVKSAALGAAALGAATAFGTVALADAAEETTEDSGRKWDYETDIAIVGSGMGGFTTAFAAHENGAKTVIVEISTVTGGGSSFSGGLIHLCGAPYNDDKGYDDFTDGLMTNQPLAHAYINDFPNFIDWLLGLGLACTPIDYTNPLGEHWGTIAELGTGDAIGLRGCRSFFDSCQDLYKEQGGTLLLQTVAQHIITDENNQVIGLQCCDNNTRQIINIKAGAVVLATGGFQADEELRTRFYGPDAAMATIHAVPYATGAGLKMAQELGASMQGSLDTFSGTLAPAWPAINRMCDPATYESLGYPDDGRNGKYALYDSHLDFAAEGSIFINLQGDRFTDEGARHYRPQQAIARQKHATALMVMDDTVFQEYWTSATYTLRTIQEQFEECILIPEVGGVLYEADTLEDLADQLIASKIHAVNKPHFLKTIQDYNDAVEAGTTAELDVPRELGNIVALTTPPFHAFPMTTSIYAPYGGLAVNEESAVLDKNKQPIPGLYATFPASGGFMRELYTGSMAAAGTTGRWAGHAAASALGYENPADYVPPVLNTTPESASGSASSNGASSSVSSSGSSSASASSNVSGSSAVSPASYKDGTYTGTGSGMGGKINVTLEISGGKITVTDISPNNETQGIGGYEAIEDGTFKSQIEAAQSADIEGVSGASVTSNAIKKAVQNALDQAAA